MKDPDAGKDWGQEEKGTTEDEMAGRFLEQELGLSFVSELSSNLTLIVTVPCSIVSDSTPWTVARQAPLSLGFSRQEYWSAVPFLPPGHLPDPGIELESLASPARAAGLSTIEIPGKPFL